MLGYPSVRQLNGVIGKLSRLPNRRSYAGVGSVVAYLDGRRYIGHSGGSVWKLRVHAETSFAPHRVHRTPRFDPAPAGFDAEFTVLPRL